MPRKISDPPDPPGDAVDRPRLTARLADGVRQHAVTLLSAPAGAGKTVLAAQWASRWVLGSSDHRSSGAAWPIAWVTLEAGDEQPGLLWGHVIDALRQAGVALPGVDTPGVVGEVDTSMLDRLGDDLRVRSEPVVLVLDGTDLVSSPEVATELDLVLGRAQAGLRLVLLGRMDPLLPLHRYRVEGRLCELRMSDLAFTAEETASVLAAGGVPDRDVAARLHARTDGWPAGVRLMCLSLAAGTTAEELDEALSGTDLTVGDYLTAEVLDRLDPQTRDFLLRASVADVITPAVADRLTGRTDSRRELAALARAGLFLERVERPRGAFRMQPLFREILTAHLEYEQPGLLRELHRWLAEGCAAEGDLVGAVRHAAAADDWVWLAETVTSHYAVAGMLLRRDDDPLVAAGLGAIPDDTPGAAAAVVRATVAAGRDPAAAPSFLARATDAVAAAAPDDGLDVCLALVAATIAIRSGTGDEALRASQDALGVWKTAARSSSAADATVDAALTILLGVAQLVMGDRAAVPTLVEAAARAGDVGAAEAQVRCLGAAAVALAVQGNLRRAADLARAGGEAAERCGLPMARRWGEQPLATAWVRLDQAHRWTRADVERATVDRPLVPALDPLRAVLHARALRLTGAPGHAAVVLDEVDVTHSPPWVQEQVRLEQAAVTALTAGPDTALRALSLVPAQRSARVHVARARIHAGSVPSPRPPVSRDVLSRSSVPLDVRVSGWLTQAQWHVRHRHEDLAVGALAQALRLAEPEELRRPFLEQGPQVRRLLRDGPVAAHAAWLFPEEPHPRKGSQEQVLLEPLTDRESQVLGHLAELLSTDEIADAMSVSVNTVRTHIRNLLRKLGAARRNEAVRTARAHGLV